MTRSASRPRAPAAVKRPSVRFYTTKCSGAVLSRMLEDPDGNPARPSKNTATNVCANFAATASTLTAMIYISLLVDSFSSIAVLIVLFVSYRVGWARRSIVRQRQQKLASISEFTAELLAVNGPYPKFYQQQFGLQIEASRVLPGTVLPTP